jgi:hypothetical protein
VCGRCKDCRDQDPRIAEEATVGLNVLSMDWPRLIGSASHTLAVKPFVGKKRPSSHSSAKETDRWWSAEGK